MKTPSSTPTCGTAPQCDLDENLKIAAELLEPYAPRQSIVLEVEIGAVGGEEDGVEGAESTTNLYTTVADAIKTVEALGLGEKGTLHGCSDLR